MMRGRRQLSGGAGDRGAITPMTAILMLVVFGVLGVALDSGLWFLKRRVLQSATDAAAMSAVQWRADGAAASVIEAQVRAILLRNVTFAEDLEAASVTTELGYYCRSEVTATDRGFRASPSCASGDVAEAARVTASGTPPIILSALYFRGPASQLRTTVTAVAARIDEAGVRIGSGLANLDTQRSAALNAMFASLLGGGGVSLDAVSYQGLAAASVDVLPLLEELNVRANCKAGTYGELLDCQVPVGDLLQAAVTVLSSNGAGGGSLAQAQADLNTIAAAVTAASGAQRVRVGNVIRADVWDRVGLGAAESSTALAAGVNAFDLAIAAAQLIDAQSTASLNVSGLGVTTVQAQVVQPAQFAVGPEGTTVRTAQVQLDVGAALNLNSYGLKPLSLRVEAAPATATITDIQCAGGASGVNRVRVNATPAVASVGLAQPIELNVLSLAGLSLARLSVNLGSVSNGTPATLDFQGSQIGVPPASGTIQRTSSNAANFSLPTAAVAVTVLGLDLTGLVQPVVNLLLSVTNNALTLLTPIVDTLLAALGVQVGYADVSVTGLRCGRPVLVT